MKKKTKRKKKKKKDDFGDEQFQASALTAQAHYLTFFHL